MLNLDHIVFGSFTLEEGTEFIENTLQTKLSDIGYHKDMGTHNRVIRISERVYLEVIAIDPKISNLNKRRWFNLDNSSLQSKLKKSPQIIGYVIENNDIRKVIQVSKTIESIGDSILLHQIKDWIDNAEYKKFESHFSCYNENDILAEIFYLISQLYLFL